MKTLYRIGLVCILALAVYFCFRFVNVFYGQNNNGRKQEEKYGLENMEKNRTITDEPTKENTPISNPEVAVETTNTGQVLTCDTKYIIKEYDKTTKTEETLNKTLPDQYIGKTREQMEEIAEEYTQAPSLEDLEKGFASMEVVAFSPEKLIVLKKYFSDMTKEHFYLVVENEYVTVYYSDLQSVYLYTDIYVPNLSHELQQEILNKKYIASEEELYNFLESYSS